MNAQPQFPALIETARALVVNDKGPLAMDESNPTCNKCFSALGIPQTEEMRRMWRELIVTTPRLTDNISGAILYNETIRQSRQYGTPFVEALAGHTGEFVTEGLDDLRERAGGLYESTS